MILEKVLDTVVRKSMVEEVLLTGCSAGGMGTFYNCDFVAAKFPNAKVRCRPEAGYFGLPIATYDSFMKGSKESPAQLHHVGSGWFTRIKAWSLESPESQACQVAKIHPDNCTIMQNGFNVCCALPPYLYPYIKTPMFVGENTADAYQVFVQGGCPKSEDNNTNTYIRYLRGILAGSMEQTIVRGKEYAGWDICTSLPKTLYVLDC